jgi:hypothetical protein
MQGRTKQLLRHGSTTARAGAMRRGARGGARRPRWLMLAVLLLLTGVPVASLSAADISVADVSQASGPGGGGNSGGASAFMARHGAITAGGDLGKANVTVREAEEHCRAQQNCVGFTFRCAEPGNNCSAVEPAKIYPIYYKSISSGNSDAAWWMYLKLPSSVTLDIDTTGHGSHSANPLIMGCHSDSGCELCNYGSTPAILSV